MAVKCRVYGALASSVALGRNVGPGAVRAGRSRHGEAVPRIAAGLPLPDPAGRLIEPVQAAGTSIKPRAVYVSNNSAAAPAMPVADKTFFRDVTAWGMVMAPLLVESLICTGGANPAANESSKAYN